VDHDVNAAKALADSIANGLAALRTGNIGGDEHLIASKLATRSRRG
jgi:hypothetical protein